ncbi:hypothetical protein OH76DRAFT_1313290, partial [Lentinus brumalis]
DNTVGWKKTEGTDDPPSCIIQFQGKPYRGRVIFRSEPRSWRTTVYYAQGDEGDEVVIKDTYRRCELRFNKEEDLLQHIHRDGDVPGVARLKDWQYIRSADGKLLQKGAGDDARVKLRLVLYDYGADLQKAQSVNDLLKAIYDVLEVHRTIYIQRRVLHRDMSANNILMYPRWADIKDRKVLESMPPLIQDILDGRIRPLEQRVAHCLLIDLDHAVLLDTEEAHMELASRTGTPMYISRSVCAGKYQGCVAAAPMPKLEGEAYELYIKVHGPARYHKFAEKDSSTRHGSIPPSARSRTSPPPPKFTHRPEHDVESTFWSMLCTLLRVRPRTFHGEKHGPPDHVAWLWDILQKHAIVPEPNPLSDIRRLIFDLDSDMWCKYFPAEMADVAILVASIAEQVAPEYAFWPTQPPEDHLHEAVQRLILQYLVEHREKDILLDPNHLRPTKAESPE